MRTLLPLLVAVALMLGFSPLAAAQSEVYPQQAGQSASNGPALPGTPILTSSGPPTLPGTPILTPGSEGNLLSVAIVGDDNVLELMQSGLRNQMYVALAGSSNDWNFAQLGDDNLIDIAAAQSGTSLDIIQMGDNNIVAWEPANPGDTLEGLIEQFGGENLFQMIGSFGAPILVQQQGGAQIIIEHYGF